MAKKTKENDKPQKPKETTAEFISSMAAVFVTGLFIVTFNLQAFEIPSTSMKNTLLVGDRLFVDRISVAPKTSWVGPLLPYTEIKRDDVIVFLHPKEPGLYVVKRIIGVPGDRIRLQGGKVFRNGVAIEEPYVIRNGTHDAYRDEFPTVPPPFEGISSEWHVSLNTFVQGGELMVPDGAYFAMGDNRDVSYDSRYWGFVPKGNVIGRPMFIFWSFETPEGQYKETGMANRIKNFLGTVLHFFDQSRWSRTFRLVR